MISIVMKLLIHSSVLVGMTFHFGITWVTVFISLWGVTGAVMKTPCFCMHEDNTFIISNIFVSDIHVLLYWTELPMHFPISHAFSHHFSANLRGLSVSNNTTARWTPCSAPTQSSSGALPGLPTPDTCSHTKSPALSCSAEHLGPGPAAFTLPRGELWALVLLSPCS